MNEYKWRCKEELELRLLGLYAYFNFVIFSSDLGYQKTRFQNFMAGASNLGLQPQEILYIGDSWDKDIYPSRDIGMKAMHIEDAWRYFGVA